MCLNYFNQIKSHRKCKNVCQKCSFSHFELSIVEKHWNPDKIHFQIHAKFIQNILPNLLQYVKFKVLWHVSTYKNVSIFGKVYMCHLLVKI